MYTILMFTNMATIDNEIPCVYVEYTHQTLRQRLHYHLYNSQMDTPKEPFHRALKYIGTKFFKWDVLETTEDEKVAKSLVAYYIHEYRSDIIGYNSSLRPEVTGELHGAYGDHRTLEEKYGKKKADQLKANFLAKVKGRQSEAQRRRMEVWNPMDDPAVREKERLSKLGAKNPAAQFDYILTAEDGTTITIDCLKDYCRKHTGFSKNGILKAIREGRKYKGMSVTKKLKTPN